jgi:FeS assembly protein IscX
MLVSMNELDDHFPLHWDASFEIVLALQRAYPTLDLDTVGLQQLKEMVVALPQFADDPALAHDGLLRDLLREWYEENTA